MKKILVLVLSLFLMAGLFADPEVTYNTAVDDTQEWVEIYNGETNDEGLKGGYLFVYQKGNTFLGYGFNEDIHYVDIFTKEEDAIIRATGNRRDMRNIIWQTINKKSYLLENVEWYCYGKSKTEQRLTEMIEANYLKKISDATGVKDIKTLKKIAAFIKAEREANK